MNPDDVPGASLRDRAVGPAAPSPSVSAVPASIAGALAQLRRVVADDAYAITFQTLGQYRSALLKHIDRLAKEAT